MLVLWNQSYLPKRGNTTQLYNEQTNMIRYMMYALLFFMKDIFRKFG